MWLLGILPYAFNIHLNKVFMSRKNFQRMLPKSLEYYIVKVS